MKFEKGKTNDPRGTHWCITVVDDRCGKVRICARDFKEKNIDDLLVKFENREIEPNFYSRPIGDDAIEHLGT